MTDDNHQGGRSERGEQPVPTKRSGKRRAGPWNQARRMVQWVEEGAHNAMEVLSASRAAPSLSAPFSIVDRDSMHRLRRYARPESANQKTSAPLLLVPPLMLTAEIYDIAPDLSCVLPLTAAGIDTWVVDFGAPETEEGGMDRTLDDHVRTVAKAVETVRRITGRDVHLGGYSQGGMFCYQAAAYLRSQGIASLITFGSPVDVHRNLPLGEDVTGAMVRMLRKAIDKPLQHMNGLPGVLTSTGFKLLTPRKEIEQIIDLVKKLHDRQELEKRAVRRRFLGGGGFVAWPGPALKTLIDEFVVHNRLMQGGFVIEGRAVTLADITSPVLMFVGTRDDIARPAAVRGILRAAPMSEVSEIDVAAGHFGLVIGSRAQRETWPSVIEWIKWRDQNGPLPALLRPKVKPTEDAEEGSDSWDFSLAFDYELLATTIAGAVSGGFRRVVHSITDANDTATALRRQIPRLRRLEQITPDTRVSVSAELASRAHEAPHATFFLWKGRAFECAKADERVSNVVRGLFHSGVKRGDHIAVLMNGRPSMLSMTTALNRMGAVAVVIPPEASDEAIRKALVDGSAQIIATDPENADRAKTLTSGLVLVLGGGNTRAVVGSVIDMEAIDPSQVTLPEGYEPDAGRARDLAMILFTQSPSGDLRPSRITNHRWAFSALGAAAACTLSETDTVYSCLPLHHPAGLLVSVGAALVGGARLALGSPFSPATFWTEVRRYGATIVFYAGEMARGLFDAPPSASDRDHPIRLFAGSGMRADLARELHERFNVGILEFYASTSHNVVFANASGEKPGAVGRPIPGTADVAVVQYDFEKRTILRDANGRAILSADKEPGAALVRAGETSAIESEGANADPSRLIKDAFEHGDTWFLLRDLLMKDKDGDHFYVESRSNVALTSHGPVFPRQVEDALYRLPTVRRAVVQQAAGDTLVATVVTSTSLDAAALTAAMEESLPLHARPRIVREVADLPMSPGFRVLPVALGDVHAIRRVLVMAESGKYAEGLD